MSGARSGDQLRAMSEEELLVGLLELLALSGWRAYHVRRSDRAIVQGSGGDGFPDVLAVKPAPGSRLIAIECKSDRGMPTPAQLAWLWAMREHAVEATIVRPATYDAAIAWIQGRGPMPDARIR